MEVSGADPSFPVGGSLPVGGVCWAGPASLVAGTSTGAAATRYGFDPARLERIEETLQSYVDEGTIAGAVALVMRDGEVVYEQAVGWQDRESQLPMPTDAIFRIASQSKAITSVAVMMLVEEGLIALGDPVSRWIPSFREMEVVSRTPEGIERVPARRQITIRDLLTHTAGMSYGGEPHIAEEYQAAGLGYGEAYGWYTAHREEPICDPTDRLGELPLVRQPGEAFVYGYNTDILGCVVERASGLPLDRFVRERITGPLGMVDTHFYLPQDDRERLPSTRRRREADLNVDRTGPGGRATMWTARARASRVAPGCCRPRGTMRASWRRCVAAVSWMGHASWPRRRSR